MTGRKIQIPRGYRIDKTGRLIKSAAHLDVSARLRQKASRKIKVARRRSPS